MVTVMRMVVMASRKRAQTRPPGGADHAPLSRAERESGKQHLTGTPGRLVVQDICRAGREGAKDSVGN
eukprot:193198-Alexandrium_andersonii.AAC.1